MSKNKQRRSSKRPNQGYRQLEQKRCLASHGWDGVGQGGAELSYYLGDAPAQVDQVEFESTIKQALEVWSDVIDVTFTETTTPRQADSLDITFASIDGTGGILAQAYFPDDVNRSTIAGDIQFDSSETWEVGNQLGSQAFDLMYVAVHEIGHALGLEHSDVSGSVLSDTVSANQQFVTLSTADQNAALSLYAASTDPVDSNEPTGDVEDPAVDPNDDSTDQPVDDQDTENRDQDRRNRRNEFRGRRSRRFGYFNFDGDTSESNFDTSDTDQSRRFNHRFTFRVFRFFR